MKKELLKKDVPANQIKTKPGRGSPPYVDGHYVITALNEIFGHGEWSFETISIEKAFEPFQVVDRTSEGRELPPKWVVAYQAMGSISFFVPGATRATIYTDTGLCDGKDASLASAIDVAAKGAVTDCLKRCARHLGPYLGLSLYEKQGTPPNPLTDILYGPHKGKAIAEASIEGLQKYFTYLKTVQDPDPDQIKAIANRIAELEREEFEADRLKRGLEI